MDFIWSILVEMGRVWADILTSSSFVFIYVLLIILVISQFRRTQTMSEPLLQGRRNMYLGAALFASGFGILGGLLGSLLLILVGVDLAGIPIYQLWLAAILLMLIQPRFLCFSYAAGAISISSLLFGYPSVNIPQLMGLVAVLHLVESILINLNGRLYPFPVYLKKQGQLRGGFNLQLLWPIPLMALLGVSAGEPSTSIVTPQWWPLLQTYSQFTGDQAYTLIPVLAILGYGEISTTQTPLQATRRSSRHLFIFSLGLLCLAILASHYAIAVPLAALFSPLGHELVVWLGTRREEQAQPIYIPPEQGVMVLDVLPGTPAYLHQIRSQDVIRAVNGVEVNDFHALQNQLNRGFLQLILEMQRGEEKYTLQFPVAANQDLGIMPVPEPGTRRYLQLREETFLTRALHRWRGEKRETENQ